MPGLRPIGPLAPLVAAALLSTHLTVLLLLPTSTASAAPILDTLVAFDPAGPRSPDDWPVSARPPDGSARGVLLTDDVPSVTLPATVLPTDEQVAWALADAGLAAPTSAPPLDDDAWHVTARYRAPFGEQGGDVEVVLAAATFPTDQAAIEALRRHVERLVLDASETAWAYEFLETDPSQLFGADQAVDGRAVYLDAATRRGHGSGQSVTILRLGRVGSTLTLAWTDLWLPRPSTDAERGQQARLTATLARLLAERAR